MKNKAHFLLIRFSSLGDVVLSTSFPRALKERYGHEIFITYLTSLEFAPLLEGHPYIDQVIAFQRKKEGLPQLIGRLWKYFQTMPVDLMIDLHGSLRSIVIRNVFFFVPCMIVDKRTPERTLLTFFKWDLLSQQGRRKQERGPHLGELLVERTLYDLAYALAPVKKNFLLEGQRPLTFSSLEVLSVEQRVEASLFEKLPEIQKLRKEKWITVVPTASYPEKRWPPERFEEVLLKLLEHKETVGHVFLLLAGPSDDFCRLYDSLEAKFPGRFLNLQGKTTLLESAYLLKKSSFCLGNDTGLPHLAESLGIPSLFILGPTGEEFGFYPHLPLSKSISIRLWCRPCTTNGKGNCIRSQRWCLLGISAERVIGEVLYHIRLSARSTRGLN